MYQRAMFVVPLISTSPAVKCAALIVVILFMYLLVNLKDKLENMFRTRNKFFQKLVKCDLADKQLYKSGAGIICNHLPHVEQNAGAASQIIRINIWLLWDAVSDTVQRFPRSGTRWQSFYGWLATQTCSVPACEASRPLRQTWPCREGPYYSTLAHASLLFLTTRKCHGWFFF